MVRILNLGSINIDHVYAVDHFVRPGETLASLGYQVFAGGKGYNQSIALARAGATVSHLGCIGEDGRWLVDRLTKDGVGADLIAESDSATGHAIIQVSSSGENAIVLHAGANHVIDEAALKLALASYGPGDWLLTQNETSSVANAMRLAKAKGLRIAFNPAPMTDAVQDFPLELVDCFILNETEAEALSGGETDQAGEALRARYPQAVVVLTLGAKGACYLDAQDEVHQAAEPVEAVDTTAAGDTFTGFFLASLIAGAKPQEALALGSRAAGICVTRSGAANSIPFRSELA
ncbi:ribokinase [Cerasicoccus arenae]|uniref:Ribokinase n=1 Tax=Cerasicoccus arenae TaxID=424488 RepID=A0A8J3DGY8_9BACT|nr:ribokinase [Cerasicoccus arenae]MBK1859108.1 ribokinase [Cerasicoccus arenae]GHB91815.1 ribokinase [Cerasicoccus arenae]